MGSTQGRYWYHLWGKWLALRGVREIVPVSQRSFCCGATCLILMSHHATLARFKTHLKQLSKWEGTLCSCALGGRHSWHLLVVWSSVVLAPQCNFQNILGFVLWHHRSSAAVDSLKCCLHFPAQCFISLPGTCNGESLGTSERTKIWEMGGRLCFLQHVPETTEQQKHFCGTWKTVK